MYVPILEQQRESRPDYGEGCMTSLSEKPLTFSADIVQSLPPYYRAVIKHLVTIGRAVITGAPEPKESRE
jgi:hypothetical protein